MKKIFNLSFFLLGIICSLTAQNIWHKVAPSLSSSANFCRFSTYDGQYLLSSNREFVQMDGLGWVTGYYKETSFGPTSFWTSVVKKETAPAGHPYFWVVRRSNPTSTSDYVASAFLPGTGFVKEQTFADNLGAPTQARPVIVELNDSVFVAFGVEFARKIKYSESTGFTEEWAKPLNLVTTAAFKHGNQFVVADGSGIVASFDENMDFLWAQSHPVEFRSLKATAGGFIGCGKMTSGGGAVVIKLDDTGGEIWRKTTTDKVYLDIAGAADGGFALTGESDSSKMILARTNFEGTQLWKQEYGKGVAFSVLQTQDGGFIVAGRETSPTTFHLIKTDAAGITSPAEEVFFNNRRVETKGVQATFEPSPSLFLTGNDATLISPADSAATILSFAPWIGGLDESNSLHIAAADYGFAGDIDYQSGLTNGKKRELNQVWKTSRDEIANLRRDFETDQNLDASVPFDLLTWPAKGNPHLRYNLDFTPVETDPALFPAPFVDANGDGIYNVYDGDYPLIKGDQMAWWMLTDSVEHKRTNGKVVGVDLLISAYALECPQNGSVDRSLFVDFEVINRSATNYHDTYLGFFTDPDLGCYVDDYFGAMPNNNTAYIYNVDNFDENCNGVQGFGDKIPVQTISFINRSLDRLMYFTNSGVSDPPPGMAEPDLPIEFFNYLRGKWKDGTSLTTGGSGYDPNSTNYTDYVFPDNPSDPQGWSMCTENWPFADRRMITSHGPFNFSAGDTFHISVAFTFHPDIPHPCPDVFGFVKPTVEQISQWKNDGALDASVGLPEVVNLPPGQSVLLDATVPGASYSWSTGATTPSINTTQPGEYSVTVTAATGCQIVENVLVQLGTSTNQPAAAPAWKMQPNPAKDFVFVECAECVGGDLKAVLRNAQGTSLVNLHGLNRQFRLDTLGLQAGFYWLELWQKGQFLGSKKVMLAGR